MKPFRAVAIMLALATGPSASAFINTVINTNDSGAGSLRQQILFYNGVGGADEIQFDIPGPGPHVIQPATPLPNLTDTGTIDGFSQTNGATIVLDGSSAGPVSVGLFLQASGVTVRGLTIKTFADSGIVIDSGQTQNLIFQNVITGNGGQGIDIDGNNNFITGNIICSNVEDGVFVINSGIRNRISQNSIFDNGFGALNALGIDLFPVVGPSGVTLNDNCDGDAGGNNLQNFPVLTSATSDGVNTTIIGTLNSVNGGGFALEFFANPTCHASGHGEGKTFLWATNATITANCVTNFTYTFPVGVADGVKITATATDGLGSTSEFSECITAVNLVPPNLNPIVATDEYATDEATPLNVAAPGVLGNDSDPEGAALQASIGDPPTHAFSFGLNAAGSFNYTPELGFSGVDQFTYLASDGTNNSALGNVTLAVGADTPVGTGVNVQFDAASFGLNPVSITISNVTAPGSTTITPILSILAGTPPPSFGFFGGFGFDIATTASNTGPVDVCFTLANAISSNLFAALRILHNEGTLVDCTTSSDYATKTVCGQVSSLSPFALAVFQSEPRDLVVTAIKAPKKITLKTGTTPKPGKLSVSVQNLGLLTEVISNATVLAQFVQLDIESLGSCAAPTATLVPPKKGFPLLLAPKKKLKLAYTVNITCANDTASGAGHEDYRYTVVLDHSALDGFPDTNASNDECPRDPSGSDKGCGNKDPVTKLLGADILTDVVQKP